MCSFTSRSKNRILPPNFTIFVLYRCVGRLMSATIFHFDVKSNLPTHQYRYLRVYQTCNGENKGFFYLQVPKSPIYPRISPFLSSASALDSLYQPQLFSVLSENYPPHHYQRLRVKELLTLNYLKERNCEITCNHVQQR